VSADRGSRGGGTVVYGAFSTDFTASPDVEVGEATVSNQDHYHVTGGVTFTVGSSRFSLGTTYTWGSKRRTIGLGGLPTQVPVLGERVEADVRYSRVVFLLGYLFGK
jgi:hypothetical protein